jgi:LPXTG-motif cell wall-anchored protein
MYGRFGIAGITVGTGGLASTGFATGWFVAVAVMLIAGGLLLARMGRRRGASR